MKRQRTLIWVIMICVPIILAGCFKGEQSMEESDPPPENAIEEDDNANGNDETSLEDEANVEENDNDTEENMGDSDDGDTEDKMTERELYLLDADGMVASQTLELPETKEVATQALEYLVKGGPVTSVLPNGFEGVIPEDTEILGLDLEDDGTMIVDVSTEFENYEPEDELKILQAMTYTLTQFDKVDRIGLWINGYPQDAMPVDGTPIKEGYSRANGINLANSDTIDLIDSKSVTLFYPATYNDNHYTVPMTQHVSMKEEDEDVYSAMVEALIDGPGYGSDISHVFNSGTTLASSPSLNNGTLELEFTEDILEDVDEAMISDDVMKSLVLSLTEDEDVDAVNVTVENVETLHNEKGESYDEPVTKDTFTPSEKL